MRPQASRYFTSKPTARTNARSDFKVSQSLQLDEDAARGSSVSSKAIWPSALRPDSMGAGRRPANNDDLASARVGTVSRKASRAMTEAGLAEFAVELGSGGLMARATSGSWSKRNQPGHRPVRLGRPTHIPAGTDALTMFARRRPSVALVSDGSIGHVVDSLPVTGASPTGSAWPTGRLRGCLKTRSDARSSSIRCSSV